MIPILLSLLAQATPAVTVPTFDMTIHLSDVVLFAGGVIAFLKVFVSQRDMMRRLVDAIGTKHPREGLLGRVEDMNERLDVHHDGLVRAGWIGERRMGLERRSLKID